MTKEEIAAIKRGVVRTYYSNAKMVYAKMVVWGFVREDGTRQL
jgi:hypothetical protein